jgi:arylsulfatase A-like enzyme
LNYFVAKIQILTMLFEKHFFPACLFALLLIACRHERTPAPPPNIVILFTDDQRFDTIHALGNEAIRTPNLDRLAAMGVAFTRAHIPGGNSGVVCAPSRAMLLSGRPWWAIPPGFAVPWSVEEGRGETPHLTFPEVFRQAGYHTFFTGKWHNERPVLHAGFTDGAYIFLGGMHPYDQGGHHSPWLHDFDPAGAYPDSTRWQGDQFSSNYYSDAAVYFIDTYEEQAPFLLYVSYTSPHDPRHAPARFQALYDPAQIRLPPNFLPEHPFDNGELVIRDEMLIPVPRTPDAVRREIAGYYAMISEVDAQIGRVLDALERKGILDHTIIVFAGDNGLAAGQHGLLGKQNLYDHSIRVPLLIAGPGIEGGRRAHSLSYLYDIFPTLCELSGREIPASVMGRSLAPALRDPQAAVRDTIVAGYRSFQRAIRTGDDWKLITYEVGDSIRTQLFNLRDDPWEMHDLAGDPAYEERVQELSEALGKYRRNMDIPFETPASK